MKLSRLKQIIKEEVKSLMEVKPFVDKKMLDKWSYMPGRPGGSPKGKLQ